MKTLLTGGRVVASSEAITTDILLKDGKIAALGRGLPRDGAKVVDVSGCWVLPGMVVFSLGLALLVSPLTAAVLAAAPGRYAGAASGVNNAVARAGSLLAVAALPALVGLSGDDYLDLDAMTSGFRGAMLWCAGLLALGGVVSWFGLARQEPR